MDSLIRRQETILKDYYGPFRPPSDGNGEGRSDLAGNALFSKGGPTLAQRLVIGAEGANNGVLIEQDF